MLIRKFGGGEADKERPGPNIPQIKPPSQRRSAQPIPSSTPTLQRPQAPKRLSMEEDAEHRERQPPAPMARPITESLPEALSELLPELLPIPTPPTRRRTAQTREHADSGRSQQARNPKRHRRPQRREQPPPTPAKSLAEKLSDNLGTEQRLGQLTSSLDHLETHVDDHVRAHIGEAPTIDSVDIGLDPIHNPTPRSLRQAIIMSEVLGPPIALRTADANRWDT